MDGMGKTHDALPSPYKPSVTNQPFSMYCRTTKQLYVKSPL